MSSEDKSQRTEDPTEKRIDQAARRGDIPSSQEVKHWFMLFGAAVAIVTCAKFTVTHVSDAVLRFLAAPHDIDMDPGRLGETFVELGWQLLLALSLPISVLIVAAIAGNVLQHRPIWATGKFKPNLSTFNPVNGAKRIFGPRGFIELAKSSAKLAVIGTAAFFVVWPSFQDIRLLPSKDPAVLLDKIEEITLLLLVTAIAVMAFIAALDLLYTRYKWTEDHKMTKSEVKDERRQSEGDPLVKAKIKRVRLQRARERIAAAVPRADVVITNPTHYAVALEYKPETMAAPVLIAKGQDNIALMIRELAEEHDIPIVENPPLARAIFSAVEIDQEVPPTFYQAVAEVIGYVFRLKGKLPKRQPTAGGPEHRPII